MKTLLRILLVFACLAAAIPSQALVGLAVATRLQQGSATGTLTANNVGSWPTFTAGSFARFSISTSGSASVRLFVQSGAGTLHAYSSPDGVASTPVPDTAIWCENTQTYGAPSGANTNVYDFNAGGGYLYVYCSAGASGGSPVNFGLNWSGVVPLFPGQAGATNSVVQGTNPWVVTTPVGTLANLYLQSGTASTVAVTGFFESASGNLAGASFSATIPVQGAPALLSSLVGGGIPAGAVGVVIFFPTGSSFRWLYAASATDFTNNYTNYKSSNADPAYNFWGQVAQ